MAAISLIMPCRDEEGFIAGAIGSLLPQLGASDELIVVDGRSIDRTREIVSALTSEDSRIRVIDNPEEHAAAAMNRGIRAASGDIIVRVDAHCVYPNEYVQRLVTALETFQADNVGGTWKITASSPTAKARAIARALAHPSAPARPLSPENEPASMGRYGALRMFPPLDIRSHRTVS